LLFWFNKINAPSSIAALHISAQDMQMKAADAVALAKVLDMKSILKRSLKKL